jgi:starch synthase
MDFFNLPEPKKAEQISRIMIKSAADFTHANTARQYIELYEKMLKRPLFEQSVSNSGAKEKNDTPQDK